MKVSKKILAFLFSIVLFDFIGLTILITVQTFIVKEYNTTALAVTLLTVLYAAAQFIAAPLLGKLSDRYGRRPILLFSLFGSAVGYFIFGIGGALWVLYISRLIDGFTGGNVSIANAYITDVSSEENRTQSLGIIGAAFGLGLIIGPVIGGLLSQISLSAPVYVAGIFSLIATIVGFFILPESLPKNKRETIKLVRKDLNPLSSIGKFITQPILGIFLIVFIIYNFTFSGFTISLPIFLIHKFNIDPLNVAGILFVSGIVSSIVQGGLIGRLDIRFGDKKLLMVGLIIFSIGLIFFFIAPIFWVIYPIIGFISLGLGLTTPTLNSIISKIVSKNQIGEIFGVNTSLNSLMSVFGPLWAGLVYDYIRPSAPYWMGAILLLIAFILVVKTKLEPKPFKK
ncbi:MAG: MFS transporter [Methanobacterium sp.]|uniref:MFS transporter n=1 Tax=Methanobacterium sp. TaxID=2164 RepID=UPI003C760C66